MDRASTSMLTASSQCGPDGAVLAPDGDVLTWCSFAGIVLRIHGDVLRESGPLITSAMSSDEQIGQVLFNTTRATINADRALACASCHPDGGTDGLSWRIGAQSLQTPILAGRVRGTPPYKWDGSDATLAASIAKTVHRLGGHGLDDKQTRALGAYLESIPPPRAPTRESAAVARGKALFETRGCTTCHDGPSYTEGDQYEFTSLLPRLDTPSLIGLASSAPYYHDGSASTLDMLLRGDGRVVGMSGELVKLTAAEREDLRTFLESL